MDLQGNDFKTLVLSIVSEQLITTEQRLTESITNSIKDEFVRMIEESQKVQKQHTIILANSAGEQTEQKINRKLDTFTQKL